MTENLQTDPIAINAYICYAALAKKPIFEMYKNLCELEANQSIDYVDFEWKYYQYYHGNRDLNLKKSAENSSSLTFSDLPMDVLEQVVNKLDMPDRLIMRKVSHDLRNLIDDSKVYCKDLTLSFMRMEMLIGMDNWSLAYRNGIGLTLRFGEIEKKTKKIDIDIDTFPMIMTDLATILKNPKLEIHQFTFLLYAEDHTRAVLHALKSSNTRIRAREVYIAAEENVIRELLQHFHPGTLKKIMFGVARMSSERMEEIMETEQWKKAECFYSRYLWDIFPIEKLFHFKEIEIDYAEPTEERLVKVRDILLKSAHFERFYMETVVERYPGDVEWEHDYLDQKYMLRIMSQNPEYDSDTLRISIPNSQDYFHLETGGDYYTAILTITRISGNL